jgi:hypothetical protein
MFRTMLLNAIYLLILAAMAVAWWFDRSKLANDLKNCRFTLKHQRETIQALTGPEKSDE